MFLITPWTYVHFRVQIQFLVTCKDRENKKKKSDIFLNMI